MLDLTSIVLHALPMEMLLQQTVSFGKVPTKIGKLPGVPGPDPPYHLNTSYGPNKLRKTIFSNCMTYTYALIFKTSVVFLDGEYFYQK